MVSLSTPVTHLHQLRCIELPCLLEWHKLDVLRGEGLVREGALQHSESDGGGGGSSRMRECTLAGMTHDDRVAVRSHD